MPLATRLLSFALLAMLVVQGQLHAVRADDGDGQDYGGNGADGDHGGDGAQAAGWAPAPPPPPGGGAPPPPPPPGGAPPGHPPPPGGGGPPPPPGPPDPYHHGGGGGGGWGGWSPHPDTQVLWGQCGGYYYYGSNRCPPGSYCRWFSNWYSQCNPVGN